MLSFARACERLHLSQPALSLAIRSLEEGLGGRLLTRTTRQVRLTPEGAALLPQALQLLADWDNVRERIHQRFTLQRGHVTIAAMPSFASNVLPSVLREYRKQHPNIEVTVQDIVHEQVGIELRVALECHQLATVGQLVAAGLGVSVVPSLCKRQMSALGVCCLPVQRPSVRKAVGLITRRDQQLSTAATAISAVTAALAARIPLQFPR